MRSITQRQLRVAPETIARYAAGAPRIDAANFRADLDRLADGDVVTGEAR